MAKVNDSLLQNLSGKVDGLVICHLGDTVFLRKLPREKKDPKSEKQVVQRSKLSGARTMYRTLNGTMLKEICCIAARENERLSGYLWFLHKNMKVFGADNYIDYSRLELTGGRQQQVFGMEMTGFDGQRVRLKWMDNSGSMTAQSTDRLMVAAIFDDEPYTPVILPDVQGIRRDGYGLVNLPEGDWQEAHLYCFFGTDSGKSYSPSMYFKVSKL